MPGYWDMPGGKVEFGESPDDAVVREVREEVNLKAKMVKPYSLFSYVSQEGRRHTVDIQYIIKVTGDVGDLKITDAHDDYKWIGRNEIDNKFKLSDEMKRAILKGFEEINNLKL